MPILNRGQHRVYAHSLAFPNARNIPFNAKTVMVRLRFGSISERLF
jgi:hypothetical protein